MRLNNAKFAKVLVLSRCRSHIAEPGRSRWITIVSTCGQRAGFLFARAIGLSQAAIESSGGRMSSICCVWPVRLI